MTWYNRIVQAGAKGDWSVLAEAFEHFHREYEEAKRELRPEGRIWDAAKMLPYLNVHRYEQWKELEAIHDWIELQALRKYTEKFAAYSEHYKGRAMTENGAKRLAEGDPEHITLKELAREVKLLMEKFAGITKGLDQAHFQIGNLIKLRAAGIEDAEF